MFSNERIRMLFAYHQIEPQHFDLIHLQKEAAAIKAKIERVKNTNGDLTLEPIFSHIQKKGTDIN